MWEFKTTARSSLRIGTDYILPASVVRDLVIYIDSDVSMRTHVTRTVSVCFTVLRQLRNIRRSVTRPVLQSLVSSLVLSRLDFSNSTLLGISAHLFQRLRLVMNAATRLIFLSSKFDHVTLVLRQLHWLKVHERINFKLAVLAYKWLRGLTLPYLIDKLCRLDFEARQQLRFITDCLSNSPSRLPLLVSGTICHSTSLLCFLYTSLHLGWKPTSLQFPFQNSFECTVPVKWLRHY